ncbi:hypothetical protein FRC07_004458 [Ceratobasidium sp. 392]|nr:hypothetical protein FRC07_004458 [Ceratobasidium sp. 392]
MDFIDSDKLVVILTPLACKADLEQWKNTRTKTHEKLKSLRDQEDLKAQPLEDVHRSDDQAFLNDLVDEIKKLTITQDITPYVFAFALQVEDRAEISELRSETFRSLFTEAQKQASKIKELFGDKRFPSESEVLVVQSTMAICGWLHFAIKLGGEKDIATLRHMWSDEVCSKAKALLEGLLGSGGDSPMTGPNVKSVQDLYTAFIDLAFGIPDASCLDLMKLLSDIGRAYHAQALVLITLCNKAVDHVKTQNAAAQDEATQREATQRVKKIGKALDDTSQALTKATEIAAEGAGILGLPQWVAYKQGEDFEKDECSVKFRETMDSIAKTFEDIGLDTAVQHEKTFETALEEDKDLTKEANARLTAATTPENTIKVNVNVKKQDGTTNLWESPHTVQAASSTLVSAIEWGILNLPEVKTELAGKPTEFTLGEDGKITKDQKIGELGLTKESVLVMAIAKN